MSSVQRRRRVVSAILQLGLVVFGVLIALAADEWLSARREARTERLWLANLRSDLARDSARLDMDIAAARSRGATAADLSRALTGGTALLEIRPDSALIAVDAIGRFSPTPFYDRTYRDLIAARRTDVIRSDRLRDQLDDYYDAVSRQERLNELYRERLWEGFQPLVIGAYPLRVQRAIIVQDTVTISPMDLTGVLRYFENTPGSDLQVRSAYRTYTLIEAQYSRLLGRAAVLLALVDSASARSH